MKPVTTRGGLRSARLAALLVVCLGPLVAAACGDSADTKQDAAANGGDAAADRDADTSDKDASIVVDSGPPPGSAADCASTPDNQLPNELACTGLYDDIKTKKLAKGPVAYAPALQLWSDGAEKSRYIMLPAGSKIDASDPDQWRFPVGTKFWKEFRWNGHRAETRLFWKLSETLWLKTSYRWSDDESHATRFAGGAVMVAGESYYIPSAKECEECHKGRDDRALGFEAVLLGLDGATGLTLPKLVAQGLLTHPPAKTHYELGDDGTGKAADALGYLHVNCGISCHNANSASEAYKTNVRLRLSASELDGSSLADSDAEKTAIGVMAKTPRWQGKTLIKKGSSKDSWLYSLISMRTADMRDQMPPIATRKVDDKGIALVKAWIEALDNPPIDDDAGTH